MGKVILEFDSIEESREARVALDGTRWAASMWDLDQRLRETTKYGKSLSNDNKEATEQEIEAAERLRDIIREILSENGLSLED